MSLTKERREQIYFAQNKGRELSPRQVKRISKKFKRAKKLEAA